MTEIAQAILALDPGAQVSVKNDDEKLITWIDGNPKKITKKQILTKRDELVATFNSLQYQRSRQQEYPPLRDQLDALYHAGVFPKEMADKLKAVKDQYPKP